MESEIERGTGSDSVHISADRHSRVEEGERVRVEQNPPVKQREGAVICQKCSEPQGEGKKGRQKLSRHINGYQSGKRRYPPKCRNVLADARGGEVHAEQNPHEQQRVAQGETVICPKCGEPQGEGKNGRQKLSRHINGYQSGKRRYPPKCRNTHFFLGKKGWTRELHAATLNPLTPDERQKRMDKIRQSRISPPVAGEESDADGAPPDLSDDELENMSKEELLEYTKKLRDERRKEPKCRRAKRDKCEVYIRIFPRGNPFYNIWIGSGDEEKRQTMHRADENKAARLSKRSTGPKRKSTSTSKRSTVTKRKYTSTATKRKWISIVDKLPQKLAWSGEYALHWSIDPKKQASRKSPPYVLPFFPDENGVWRQATHEEMRELWCPLLIDALLKEGRIKNSKWNENRDALDTASNELINESSE